MGENNGKNLVIECFVLLLLKKNIEYVIIIKNIEKSLHISIFFRTVIYEGEFCQTRRKI